jgi:PAS domain S-box-containing protein
MSMRVGELARRTGVGVSTLRAWERRYHFLEPQRSPAGQRIYVEADVQRVDAVLRLVAEGLTLSSAVTRVASVGQGSRPEGEAETLLFNQILQAAGQGLWVVLNGRTRYANKRMADLMGYSVEELLAIPVFELFDPHGLPPIKEQAEQIRSGQRLHFTRELRRADGSTFLAEVTSTPLLNRAGRYEGAVAVVNDITARHAADTQARLRATILESIGQAVAASTPDGTVTYVNAAAERLFGWRAADVVGKDSSAAFPAPEEPELGPRILARLKKGKGYSGRFKMARSDGSGFVAQLTSAAAVDEHGTVVGFVGVFSDETERDQRDRSQQRRESQADTIALLGAQALRQHADSTSSVTLMTEAVEATRRLLDADRVKVLTSASDGNELRLCAASPRMDQHLAVPAGSRSFAGYTALARKVVIVDNAERDGRFDSSPTEPGDATVSAIGAPIYGPDGISGVLVAECTSPDRFDAGDSHFIQGMANIIGTALLNRGLGVFGRSI